MFKSVTGNEVIPESLLLSIRRYYPSGLRFDDTVLRLLEESSGCKINDVIQIALQKNMFHRKDDLFFLQEMVEDTVQHSLIKKNTLLEEIDKYGCIVLDSLYKNFCNQGKDSCIRNEDDFEDYLMFLMPNDIRIASALNIRLIRKIGIPTNTAVNNAANKVVQTITESGCITQEELLFKYPLFSDIFLQRLLEKHTDAVIQTNINDFLCYQTVESIGLSSDFSTVLNSVLEEIEQLSLEPSQDIIHALLSVHLGYNFRDEYNISDNKTFRRIISIYYTDDKSRVWKSGSFMEVSSKDV